MRVLIAGPGAIGCMFAARLAEAGCDVLILDHDSARSRRLDASGLRIDRPDGAHVCRLPVACIHDALPPGAPPLAVLLAVKAYDTETAGRAIASRLALDTPLVSVQNGIGNDQVLTEGCGFRRVICAVTACGATRLGEGCIREAGVGPTRFACATGAVMPSAAGELGRALAAAGLPVAFADDVRALVWSKAVINAAINPVTALWGVTNGECVEREDARCALRAAAYEAQTVATALGIDLPYVDAAAEAEAVCRGTRENLSSMLQDVRAGRRTEVRQINGKIVEAGRRLGVRTPVNDDLLERVLALKAG